MFKKLDTKNAKMGIESVPPAKVAKLAKEASQVRAINTPVTGMQPLNFAKPAKDPEISFRDFSKFSDGQSSNTHFPLSDETDLFFYLHADIITGGPYLRLWPQVRGFVSRQLPADQVAELEYAHDWMTRRQVEDGAA